MYIRQAVWVRGQKGLRRLSDESRLGELLCNSGRQSLLCNVKINDKSHLGTCVLTADTFSAKRGAWDQ